MTVVGVDRWRGMSIGRWRCSAGTRAVCGYLRPFGFVAPKRPRVSRKPRGIPALREWSNVAADKTNQGWTARRASGRTATARSGEKAQAGFPL